MLKLYMMMKSMKKLSIILIFKIGQTLHKYSYALINNFEFYINLLNDDLNI